MLRPLMIHDCGCGTMHRVHDRKQKVRYHLSTILLLLRVLVIHFRNWHKNTVIKCNKIGCKATSRARLPKLKCIICQKKAYKSSVLPLSFVSLWCPFLLFQNVFFFTSSFELCLVSFSPLSKCPVEGMNFM